MGNVKLTIVILKWLLLIILIALPIYFYYKIKFFQTPKKPSPIIPSVVSTSDATKDWKIYQNFHYGFEIKYPSNFFIAEDVAVFSHPLIPQKALVKISDDPQFENSETALVIYLNVFTTNNEDSASHLWPEQKEEFIANVLNEIGYQSLKEKYGEEISGGFLGDPPWGFYRIRFPLSELARVVQFNIKIHVSDDPSYGGRFEKHHLAKEIISTFRVIN